MSWSKHDLLVLLLVVFVAVSFMLILTQVIGNDGSHTQLQPFLDLVNATINSPIQITAYVIGFQENFNVTSVMVDGVQQFIAPSSSVLEPGQTQEFIVVGNGANWMDGLQHNITFIATNGFRTSIAPVVYGSVSYGQLFPIS